MVVYFFRHGLADWPGFMGSDEERPLNEQGIKETRRMAKLLGNLGGEPSVIFSSPLPRAMQTAKIAAQVLDVRVVEKACLAPGCTADKLRLLLKKQEAEEIMVVGHQPDFSAIIKSLTGARTKLSKSGIARVDLDEEFSGKLIWLLPSKLVGVMRMVAPTVP